MPGSNREPKKQIDLLRSLPLHSSTEERVETLWRQLLLYKSAGTSDLSEPKARRAQAEAARAQAEAETLKATRAACERIRADAASELEEAKQLKDKALKARQAIESAQIQANEVKAQAEEERQRILSAAENEAREVIEKARLAAQQETTELRRQALKEISTVVTRVEDMSAAVDEELEAQRILTNVAQVKATSKWLLTDETEAENENQELPPDIDTVEPDIATDIPVAETVVTGDPSAKAAKGKKETSKP